MISSRFGHYALGIVAAALILQLFFPQPAYGEQASTKQRQQMAVAIAFYIRYADPEAVNPFGSKAVELGTVVIEDDWALGEWRSVDRRTHGEVLFRFACDSWGVSKATTGTLAQTQQLSSAGVPTTTATKLIADLGKAYGQQVAYLRGPPGHGC